MHSLSINCRVLICCTCHFQSSSSFFVYFGFFCLQVSSGSNIHPDTRLWRWPLIQAHLFSCVVGREGHCKQIPLACMGSAHSGWTTLCLPQLKVACTFRVHTAQAPWCSARALSKWAVCFVHFPCLICSGFWLLRKDTDPDGLFVLCPSQVWATQVTGCLVSALFQVDYMSYSPPWSWLLSFLVCCKSTTPGVPFVSSWELISGCDTPGRC